MIRQRIAENNDISYRPSWLLNSLLHAYQWTVSVARLDSSDAWSEQTQWPLLTEITNFKRPQLFIELQFIGPNNLIKIYWAHKILFFFLYLKFLLCRPFESAARWRPHHPFPLLSRAPDTTLGKHWTQHIWVDFACLLKWVSILKNQTVQTFRGVKCFLN